MSLDPAVLDTLLHDPARLTAGQRAEIARRLAMPVGWTREATEQLAALWRTGAPCSLIAAAINRDLDTAFSRNAVIGKVNRLGLAGRAADAPRTGKPRGAPPPFAPPFGRRCSLTELTDATCRWPVGEPGTPEFYFCGGKPLAARPYCAYHAALAYQPGTTDSPNRREHAERRR